MTKPSMTARAISDRLRQASALADLHPDRRLDAKLDMTREGITRRLRQVADLLAVSNKLRGGGEERRPR